MNRSNSSYGRSRVFRACALAMVRIWIGTVVIVIATLLLTACGGSGNEPVEAPPVQPPVANTPPVANAGADQLVLTGAAVSVAGTGTDSDGSIASYSWAQTGGAAVTLTGANAASLGFTAPATAAALTFELTVTDNLGLARTDSVTINVNAPPVAAAGDDQNVAAGANVSLGGGGTDANGSIASYSWTQTAGAAVTLTGASSATSSFTAPATAAPLEFRLTVTDNQGAIHFDIVAVNVTAIAAPVIAHHPTQVRAHEHASALFYVAASGENLSYEWIYPGGVVVKSASPEPFLLRGTAGGLGENTDTCYRVIVSNAAGSVTSEPGCLEVLPAAGEMDPTDEDNLDDWSLAEAYGNSALKIVQQAAGGITGGALTTIRSSVPRIVGPHQNCFGGGEFVGSALDGQVITQVTNLPLGRHTLSLIWLECGNGDPDEPSDRVGGIMIAYDFPSTFGVGSYTMYLSGFGHDWDVMNGILEVTSTRGVTSSGWPTDEFVITLLQDFSVANLRCECLYTPDIELTRRLTMDESMSTDATLQFDLNFNVWDGDGFLGTMFSRSSSSNEIDLHYDPDIGDTGEPSHTSDGHVDVGLGTSYGTGNYLLGTVIPAPGNGGGAGWVFNVDPPEEPEED